MKSVFFTALHPSAIISPSFHGVIGIWDEVLAIFGVIAFIVILIHMFFFEDRRGEPFRPENKPGDHDDKNR